MQWLINLVAEKVIAEIGVPPCYIDRGDFTGEFASINAGLNDGLWHEIDFSSIVPANAKAVVIRLRAENTVAGESIQVQPKDTLKDVPGHCAFSIPSADITNRTWMVIGLSTDLKIIYNATSLGVWSNSGVSLRGWIL